MKRLSETQIECLYTTWYYGWPEAHFPRTVKSLVARGLILKASTVWIVTDAGLAVLGDTGHPDCGYDSCLRCEYRRTDE